MRIKTEPLETENDNFETEYGPKISSFVKDSKKNHDIGNNPELINESAADFKNGLGTDYLLNSNDGLQRRDVHFLKKAVSNLWPCKEEVEDLSYVTPEVQYEVEVTSSNEENQGNLGYNSTDNGTIHLPYYDYNNTPASGFSNYEDLNGYSSTLNYCNADTVLPTYHTERDVPVIGEDDLEKQFREVFSTCSKSSSEEATKSFMNALHLLDRVVEQCFGSYQSQCKDVNNSYFFDESVGSSTNTCKSPYPSLSSSAESTVTAEETGDDTNITHCMGSDDVLKVMLKGASSADQNSQPDISDSEYSPLLQYAVEQQCITTDQEIVTPTEETRSSTPLEMQQLLPVPCENVTESDEYQIMCLYNQDVQEEIVTTSTDLNVTATSVSQVWLTADCVPYVETVVSDNLPVIQLESQVVEAFPSFFKVEVGEFVQDDILLTEEVTDNTCTLNYLKTEDTELTVDSSCLRPSSLPNDCTVSIKNVPSKRHVKRKSKARIKRILSESDIPSLPSLCAIEEYMERTVSSSTSTYTSVEMQNVHDSFTSSDTSSTCHITETYVTQNDGTTKCHYCGKRFITKDKLQSHISAHHKVLKLTAKEKKFYCDICDIKFENLTKLISHLKLHAKDKNYDCKTCKKSFSLSCFMNHQRISRKLKM